MTSSEAPPCVGLMDGRAIGVALGPHEPEAPLLPRLDRGRPLPVEQVAYVAWPLGKGERAPPPLPGWEPFRVHVAGGRSFRVHAPPPEGLQSTSGFSAHAAEASDFGVYFFYFHGVTRIEVVALTGELLIADGLVSPSEIEVAAAAQTARMGEILIEQRRVAPEAVSAAVDLQLRSRLRLGEVLIERGLASQADIDAALAEQRRRKGKKIGELLVEMNIVAEDALTRTLAKKFGMRVVDLVGVNPPVEALALIPLESLARLGFLPIGIDERSVTIAIADPLQTGAHEYLRYHLRPREVREVLAMPSRLREKLAELNRPPPPEPERSDLSKIVAGFGDPDADPDLAGGEPAADGTIVRLANQLLIDAVARGASDIHIEPDGPPRGVKVRLRIDGDCVDYAQLPAACRTALPARLKILAGLDISERRRPQDGKIKMNIGDKTVELRMATLPTVNGNEDVVLRVLAQSKPMPLPECGLTPANLAMLETVIRRPHGLVLCVGPTGSGKTTTLHSILGALNTPDTKIWTAEDPVEITQVGLRQLQVMPKIGLDFAAALRSFLRADPDIIMVGEMRDRETAGIAVEASLTGHLVLSTLHTNSAPETIVRLLDMGLDPFSFSDALAGVLAQRLARRLCKACRVQVTGTREEYDAIEAALAVGGTPGLEVPFGSEFRVWRAAGCEACGGSGLRGRVALHEVLAVDDGIRSMVQRKARADELREAGLHIGMRTLLQDGVAKVLAGDTDLRQVLAVCSR